MKKIDIEFDFRDHHYDAIVRVKEKKGGKVYHITVLNWELERILYENPNIEETEGILQANLSLDNTDQSELKLVIASSLGDYLKIPCFAGEQCVNEVPHEEGWEHLHPIARHDHPLAYRPGQDEF